ncbi:MAG: TonB-dependent receptor [Rhodobacteraceae bacterium]|nr:MAG: TonB-dependent receptor [Paracoccaceae bacterium]
MRFTSLSLRHRAVLMGTSALLLSAPAAFAQEATVLDPILIEGAEGQIQAIEGSDEGVGATALDADAIAIRGDGSGDANTALTTLPQVQGATADINDAGSNIDDVLDLKPVELSISGATLSENSILLNGVGIDSVTGNTSPTTATDLNRENDMPNMYSFYGMHTQNQFIPSSMLDSAEILSSNISAQYGGFQGGVVKYELNAPTPERAEGSVTLNYSSSDWTDYKIGTEDGENPEDQPEPTWTKLEYAFDVNQPLGDRSALRFGFSRRSAEGRKAMNAQYVEDTVDSDSRSDFYTLSYLHDFLNGDRLTLSGQYTDYNQDWDSNFAEDFHLDVTKQSLSLDAKYEKELGTLSFAGVDLRDTKLTLRAIRQDNKNANENDATEFYYWYGSYRNGYYSDAFEDWCIADETGTTSVSCLTGGLGSTDYSDTQNRIEARFEGDIWNGKFLLGGAMKQISANRTGSGFTYYSTTTRMSDSYAFDAFNCPAGDAACYEDAYFNRRIIQEAYDIDIDVFAADTFAELEQSWGDFTLRAGLRADYNDVLENLDIAPRIMATWKPSDDFSLSLGANRYYSDSYLKYAIHDALPRGLNQTRSHDSATGEVEATWETQIDLGGYYYTQGNLDTPYTDEIALTALFRDRWTGGTWRLNGTYREGKDQFAASEDSSSRDQTLTNDGWTEYKAVSLEYENNWEINHGALDSLGIYISGVMEDSATSANSYFAEEVGSTSFYYYNGQSYTYGEFERMRNNLDIPLRTTLELRSSWHDERLKLGLGANVVFGYNGVRYTGEDDDFVNDSYGEVEHYIYEDYSYKTTATAFLTAKLRLAEVQGKTVDLNMKLSNLFNDTGNEVASDDNPWLEGRSLYLGTSLTW